MQQPLSLDEYIPAFGLGVFVGIVISYVIVTLTDSRLHKKHPIKIVKVEKSQADQSNTACSDW